MMRTLAGVMYGEVFCISATMALNAEAENPKAEQLVLLHVTALKLQSAFTAPVAGSVQSVPGLLIGALGKVDRSVATRSETMALRTPIWVAFSAAFHCQ